MGHSRACGGPADMVDRCNVEGQNVEKAVPEGAIGCKTQGLSRTSGMVEGCFGALEGLEGR